MKKVFIRTMGCQMNERDSEVVAGLMANAGFALTDTVEAADVVIINTCSVRQHAEDKVWSEVGKIDKGTRMERRKAAGAPIRQKPLIGIIGCMAQNYKEAVFERSPAVDFVVGPTDIAEIPRIVTSLLADGDLHRRRIWETEAQSRPEEIYHTGFHQDKEHAFVVISEGCSNFCSYCVVPYTRGPLRHREHARILDEIEKAAASGIRKVTLLGQNVNAYTSGGVDFSGLLEKVNAVKGITEFSFVTSHPRDTAEKLFTAMAGLEKCKKYLHLPAQSGSDRILKLMNRGYDAKYYLELCAKYRKIIPDGLLTTDIIVGFSTETEDDFLATYRLLEEVGFDAGFIFKYSPRPHSAAFTWQDDVPKAEKERRHALVLELQKKISVNRRKKR